MLCIAAACACVPVLPGNEGTTCVIPFRGDDMEWRHLKLCGDYGQIVPVPFSPHDEDSIRRAIGDSDVVINLMGKVRTARGCSPLAGLRRHGAHERSAPAAL